MNPLQKKKTKYTQKNPISLFNFIQFVFSVPK